MFNKKENPAVDPKWIWCTDGTMVSIDSIRAVKFFVCKHGKDKRGKFYVSLFNDRMKNIGKMVLTAEVESKLKLTAAYIVDAREKATQIFKQENKQ